MSVQQLFCFIGLAGFLLGTSVAFADEKPNCKLTIRTQYKEGNKELKIEEIYAKNRLQCKTTAQERQKIKDPEEIAKINVSFSFREKEFTY